MKTKLISLLVLLCWLPMVAGAQTVADISEFGNYDPYANLPQTPAGAALFKATDSPVNHGRGSVNITIPIYELKVDDIVIPIYLEYQGGGLKVNDPYSRVGAGWTLHADPIVSRSVVGLPDEQYYLWNAVTSPMTDSKDKQAQWQHQHQVDKMPDKFCYRLLDRQGGFLFSDGGNKEVVMHPYEPVKVEFENNLNTFRITDENGLVYTFGDKGKSRYDVTSSIPVTSEWLCSSVRSQKSGRVATFSYTSGQHTEYFDNSYFAIEQTARASGSFYNEYLNALCYNRVALKDGENKKVTIIGNSGQETTSSTGVNGILSWIFPTIPTGFTSYDNHLSNITCGEYSIDFINGDVGGDVVLDRIVICRNGKTIREVKLYTEKMKPGYSTETSAWNEHCSLDSVRIMNGGGIYKMTYYGNGIFPLRRSKAIDHWGYYNGKIDNTSLIAKQTMSYYTKDTEPVKLQFLLGTANREPDSDYMHYGALARITYPTGGYTDFEYEPNQYEYYYPYSDTNGWMQNYIGGGIRIRKITEVPEKGKEVTRTFTYPLGYCRFPPVRYANDVWGEFKDYVKKDLKGYYKVEQPVESHLETTLQWYDASPFMKLPAINGSYVVYDYVTEERSDGAKTVYQYRHDKRVLANEPEHIDRRSEWEYGKLTHQAEYAKDDAGTYRPVRKSGYRYGYLHTRSTCGYIHDETWRVTGMTPDEENPFFQTSYPNSILSGAYLLTEEYDTLYDAAGNFSVTKTEYRYSVGNDETEQKLTLLRTKTCTLPDGTVETEERRYPTDMNLTDSTAESTRKAMEEKHIIGTPLQQYRTVNGERNVSVAYDYALDTDSFPRLAALRYGKKEADKVRIRYAHYTPQGKPMEKIVDGVPTVYLYGYGGELLIAEIRNAGYSQVCSAYGSESMIEHLRELAVPQETAWQKLKSLEEISPQTSVTLFKHEPGVGITQIIGSGKSGIHYAYDAMARLTEVLLEETDGTKSVQEHLEYIYVNP